MCFSINGTTRLGSLRRKQCSETVIPATTVTSNIAPSVNDVPCPWGHPSLCWEWNPGYCPSGRGTPTLREVLWVCGSKLYSHLPPHWGGVCAPAQVMDHFCVVSAISQQSYLVRRDLLLRSMTACGGLTCLMTKRFGPPAPRLFCFCFRPYE